jgi:hypothetical protein
MADVISMPPASDSKKEDVDVLAVLVGIEYIDDADDVVQDMSNESSVQADADLEWPPPCRNDAR